MTGVVLMLACKVIQHSMTKVLAVGGKHTHTHTHGSVVRVVTISIRVSRHVRTSPRARALVVPFKYEIRLPFKYEKCIQSERVIKYSKSDE